jgi:hypothetical protein
MEISEDIITVKSNHKTPPTAKAVYNSLKDIENGVDQSYKPDSEQPQSGTAVAEAVANTIRLDDEIDFVFLGGDASSKISVDLAVENELSPTSTNPIQNGAVAKRLSEISLETTRNSYYIHQNSALIEELQKTVSEILLSAHPIGSLYWSSKPTNPSMIFGGTWEAVKDKFILAAGDNYAAGSKGGESNVLLETRHMPVHNHRIIKAVGTDPLDTAYQPAWAIKLKSEAIVNTEENPETGTTGGIGYTGGNVPHNNMPPYEVYYCWKRIA